MENHSLPLLSQTHVAVTYKENTANGFIVQAPFVTAIPEQPVTEARLPYLPAGHGRLTNAGTARATIAPSNEQPNGTTEHHYAKRHQHQTVVQQHVEYWDTDHDGIIWPQDTYNGVRAWGWNPLLSLYVAFIIHFALSYLTLPSYLPDPFFRIYTARLYKDKHGSDSMTYDNEGRFRPQNFEEIFAKYDRGNKGGLDWNDVLNLWHGQMMAFDFFGWSATFLEWLATYLLIWPEDGVMKKEEIRGIYDGSIFYKKAEEHKRKQIETKHKPSRTSPSLVAKVKKLL